MLANSPCVLPGGCPLAASARAAALDAEQTAGAALASAVSAERRAQTASRRAALGNTLKWAVGILVTALMAWQTARMANQESRITDAVVDRVEKMVDAKLTANLVSTRQSNLDTAREALKMQRAEELAARNPAPLASDPDRVAPVRR